MKEALNHDSPFPRRLFAYLQERFPLVGNVLLIVSYYSSNQFLAQALTNPGQPVHYSWHSLMGGVVLLCMFLHLRVFDEHKDYEDDVRFYPERVLSKGLITLGHLKIIGGIAIALELILSACRGGAALTAVLIALGFSLLMLKEFFVAAWLKRHFVLYALSHMLIMPLFALVTYSFAIQRYPWTAPGWYWLYAFVGFFVTFNWEVSRKIRAPEDEVDGLETYSQIFGTYGAAYLVIAVRLLDTLMVSLVGLHLGLPGWFYTVLVVLLVVFCYGLYDFRVRTCRRTANRLQKYAGVYIVAFDLCLVVALVVTHGMRFGAS
jgi:4-hydroxybenzoate polyprenyltransferase